MTTETAVVDRKARRRRRGPTPLKLTKERLTAEGATWDVVERRIPTTFITRDFLGCIDIIACSRAQGIVGIQVTGDPKGSAGNHVKRQTKIEAEPRALRWLESGGRIEVWSWALRGERGKTKDWTLRRSRAFVVDGRIGWAEIDGGAT